MTQGVQFETFTFSEVKALCEHFSGADFPTKPRLQGALAKLRREYTRLRPTNGVTMNGVALFGVDYEGNIPIQRFSEPQAAKGARKPSAKRDASKTIFRFMANDSAEEILAKLGLLPTETYEEEKPTL